MVEQGAQEFELELRKAMAREDECVALLESAVGVEEVAAAQVVWREARGEVRGLVARVLDGRGAIDPRR